MNRSGATARFQAVLGRARPDSPDNALFDFSLVRSREQPLWWLAFAGLCLVLLFPLLVVDVPPLGDYPNHLARAFVLASLPGDPVLARMYAPHWSIIPNLAIDLITPPLIRLLPVYIAGRVVIAISLLLPVVGAVAYHVALGGRWWSLAVGLVAFHTGLLYGFLNFDISLGLAFLLAATWLRWRETRPALAISVALIGGLALFICHLMGLLIFAILIGSAELAQLRSLSLRPMLLRGVTLVLVFAIPAGLYAMTALQSVGGGVEYVTPAEKLLQLCYTFVNYNWPLDVTTACAAFGVPFLCIALRRGTFPRPAAVAVGVLLAVYLAAPFAWKGTFLLDTRFAITLGFIMFAGFVPTRWPPALRAIAVCGLGILFVARMAVLTTAWAAHNADLADIRQALAPVQPGQAVYVADASIEEAPAYWAANPYWLKLSDGVPMTGHLGALTLLERRAYWPFEFDIPSQQPIRTLPPYAALAAQVGSLPDRRKTVTADLCGFDWVLLLDAQAVPRLPEHRFHQDVDAKFASLYAITQCEPNR